MKKLLAFFTIIGILGLFACGGPVKEKAAEETIVEEEITEVPIGDSVELIVEDSLAVEVAPEEDTIAK